MPVIRTIDPSAYVTSKATHDISFLSALQWLAIATSPAPYSRYRPSNQWTIAKYATVCDPRRASGSIWRFVTNPGIYDLDPHQKTVLSDDIGVALALGLVDEIFGIKGLADVYAECQAGRLQLKEKGRHRKMPDFIVLLRKPLRGCTTVLLECKGSVSVGRALTQLKTACNKQLANVAMVNGVDAKRLPKLALASELSLGYQAAVHVDDPDALADPPAERQLKANLLALEYSLFGDLRTANRVWHEFDLPTFAVGEEQTLPSPEKLRFEDSAIARLRPRRFHVDSEGAFEQRSVKQSAYAFTEVIVDAPTRLYEGRQSKSWSTLIDHHGADKNIVAERSVADSPGAEGRREIRERSFTSSGITAQSITTVWFEGTDAQQ